MSIREEQCRKVCRILDDVLANRPTERDALCVAVEKAFEALSQHEQQWIPVKERNPIEYDNPIEFMATLEDPSGERYVEFIEWDGYEWDDFYTDDNERGVWGYDKVIAWMKKTEPWEGDAE